MAVKCRSWPLASRIATTLAQEQGQALLLVIIVIAALTISVAGIVNYVTSNQNAASRTQHSQRALGLAEAGLNDALARITVQDFNNGQFDGTTFSTTATPTSLDHGSYSYVATKCATPCASGPKVWTITSTGTDQNGLVHKLRTTLAAQQAPAFNYGYFVADPSGCTTTKGNSTIMSSVWINGDYCPNGTTNIANPDNIPANKVTVYIGGSYIPQNSNNYIGELAGTGNGPVASVTVAGNCNGHASICTTADKVYANTYSQTPVTLVKPPVYPDVVYSAANWSAPSCSVGSFTFDTNTTRNSSVGTVDFPPNSNFDCSFYSGANLVGRLACTCTGNPKSVTIQGTIFIDANKFNLSSFNYQGFGSIYVNGWLNGTANAKVCGPPNFSCVSNGWDGSVGDILFVAVNAGNNIPGFDLTSAKGWYDIDAYVNGKFDNTGGSTVTGSVLADSGNIAGSAGVSRPGPAPAGSPVAWNLIPGVWQQTK
jgi:Tfp pilus assembly protein PilX